MRTYTIPPCVKLRSGLFLIIESGDVEKLYIENYRALGWHCGPSGRRLESVGKGEVPGDIETADASRPHAFESLVETRDDLARADPGMGGADR